MVAITGEPAPLLEAVPYMELEPWIALVVSCCTNDRLAVDARKVASALIRVEATHLKKWIVHNPEERALLGFFAGWFVFLISLFGILEELVTIHPLQRGALSRMGGTRDGPAASQPSGGVLAAVSAPHESPARRVQLVHRIPSRG